MSEPTITTRYLPKDEASKLLGYVNNDDPNGLIIVYAAYNSTHVSYGYCREDALLNWKYGISQKLKNPYNLFPDLNTNTQSEEGAKQLFIENYGFWPENVIFFYCYDMGGDNYCGMVFKVDEGFGYIQGYSDINNDPLIIQYTYCTKEAFLDKKLFDKYDMEKIKEAMK